MRKSLGTWTALSFAVLAPLGLAAEVTYPLSGDNTTIEFVGTKPNGKHEGGFKAVKGKASVDGADLGTLKVSLDIDMTSLYSDNPKLTSHLKSPDFFGVKTNPKSKFVSTKVAKKDGGYEITGDLTLNGKTKAVTFPARISVADGTLTLASSFTINRNDWSISYGKGKIDDDVTIRVKLKAEK